MAIALLVAVFVVGVVMIVRTAVLGTRSVSTASPTTEPVPSDTGSASGTKPTDATTSSGSAGLHTDGRSGTTTDRRTTSSDRPTRPKSRVVHAAGVRLDSVFSQSNFNEVVMNGEPLHQDPRCGLLVNKAMGLTVRVTAVRKEGPPGLSFGPQTCVSWNEELEGILNEPPVGDPDAYCRGATLAPGEGCWIAIWMESLPAEPAQGHLYLDLEATCTDASGICAAAASLHPTSDDPVTLTATTSFDFTIEGAPPPADSTCPSRDAGTSDGTAEAAPSESCSPDTSTT